MLIDDDSADNLLHQMVIEEMGIAEEIVIAKDGEEALEILKKAGVDQQPNLIFLDLNMPKINGWEFLTKYANLNLKQNHHPIIMILTTSLNSMDQEKATREFSNQTEGYYIKPLNEKILKDILGRFF